MRTHNTAFVIFVIYCIVFSFSGVDSVCAEMTDEQFYSHAVDRYIEKSCFMDKRLSGSELPSMQKYGALNCLKASYVGFYKHHIVRQLIHNKDTISRKEYKIEQFINSDFFEVFRLAAEDIKDQYNDIHGIKEE